MLHKLHIFILRWLYWAGTMFHRVVTCNVWPHYFAARNPNGVGMCSRCDRLYYTVTNGMGSVDAVGRVNANGKYGRRERRRVRKGVHCA